jgi:DNA-binding transcriptional regulator GbsR (MarR family)
MDIKTARHRFITRWGELGSSWGICKTMAQVHALLLISSRPLCTDEIMKELDISRGNVCMNLKSLQEWGLVYKSCQEGERKEFYVAEKDMYIVFRQIVLQRKKQELEPILDLLEECSAVEEKCKESAEFCHVVKDIKLFSSKANRAIDTIFNTNPDWFLGSFLRMIR